MSLSVDLGELEEVLSRVSGRRIGLQIPEGLLGELDRIVSFIEERGFEPVILADPCYGACDIPIWKAKILRLDAIIHLGHSEFLKLDFPVFYVEVRQDFPEDKLAREIEKIARDLGLERTALVSTVQYVHKLRPLSEKLDLDVVIPRAGGARRYDGQVLGCSIPRIENIDAWIFVGRGTFHPLGLFLASGKPVVIADPVSCSARLFEEGERFLRMRMARIELARDARKLGIVLSLKLGQMKLGKAMKLVEIARKNGRKAYLLAMDYITSTVLDQFHDLEAFVVVGCPRIALDDMLSYRKPVLLPVELEYMLGLGHLDYSKELTR